MIESKYYKEYNYLNDITYLDVASMGRRHSEPWITAEVLKMCLQKALEE